MGACCSTASNTVTQGNHSENTNSTHRVSSILSRRASNNGQNRNPQRNTLNEEQQQATQETSPFDNTNNPQQLYIEIEELQRDLSLMEAFFQSVLGQAYQMGMGDPDIVGGQQRSENNAPPPASQKAMRQIPTVTLCAEDLTDENNRECCICFEENIIGVKVARLPCGHVYHRPCIEGWLCKHCTCPVCRYELETDDASYERGRLERMRHRKPRFRKHELNNMSIRQLRELLTFLKLTDAGTFTEKREIIDKIINSGKIEVIASPEPLEFKLSELRALGVGKLKRAMNEAGVFFDQVDVVEKEDMVQLFINSGRVILIADDPVEDYSSNNNTPAAVMNSDDMFVDEDKDRNVIDDTKVGVSDDTEVDDGEKNESKTGAQNDESNNLKSNEDINPRSNDNVSNNSTEHVSNAYTSTAAASSSRNATASSSDPSSSRLKAYLRSKSISELKAMGRELGVSLLDCVEKAEMVDKLSPFFNG